MRFFVWRYAAALGLLVLMHPCQAELVRFEIAASVDVVDDPGGFLGDQVPVNAPLSGVLQYDLDLLDFDAFEDSGRYAGGPVNGNLIEGAIGGNGFFQTTERLDIVVINDSTHANGGDLLTFTASGDTTPSSTDSPEINRVETTIDLVDSSATVLTNGGLPTELVLSDFDLGSISVAGLTPTFDQAYTISATIHSITQVTPVSPGDVDGDGNVDGEDFLRWQRDLGDAVNLSFWKSNYGESIAAHSGNAVVPEPASLTLIALGLFCARLSGTQRRSQA